MILHYLLPADHLLIFMMYLKLYWMGHLGLDNCVWTLCAIAKVFIVKLPLKKIILCSCRAALLVCIRLLGKNDSMGTGSDGNGLEHLIVNWDINYLHVNCINNRSSFYTKDIRNFEDFLNVRINCWKALTPLGL